MQGIRRVRAPELEPLADFGKLATRASDWLRRWNVNKSSLERRGLRGPRACIADAFQKLTRLNTKIPEQ